MILTMMKISRKLSSNRRATNPGAMIAAWCSAMVYVFMKLGRKAPKDSWVVADDDEEEEDNDDDACTSAEARTRKMENDRTQSARRP